MPWGKRIQPPERRVQQGASAAEIATLIVVKGSGDLNDPLQELLLGLRRSQPYLLPSLMSIKKTAGVELFDAAQEFDAVFASLRRGGQ